MAQLSSAARGYGAAHRHARAIVLERDGYVCQWCGAPATEADHLGPKIPDPRVMVASCRTCNARRGGRKRWTDRARAGASQRW